MGERGLGREPETGNGDSPQASTEQRLEGGQAAGKGLRVRTSWAATSGGQRGCSDVSPPVDGEGSSKGARAAGKVLRHGTSVPGRTKGFGSSGLTSGSGSPGGGGRQDRQRSEPWLARVAKHPKPSRGANRRGGEKPRGRNKRRVWQRAAEGDGHSREDQRASADVSGHLREWMRDGEVGGRARENESQERRVRRESGSAVSRRSEGAAKSMRAAIPDFYELEPDAEAQGRP